MAFSGLGVGAAAGFSGGTICIDTGAGVGDSTTRGHAAGGGGLSSVGVGIDIASGTIISAASVEFLT